VLGPMFLQISALASGQPFNILPVMVVAALACFDSQSWFVCQPAIGWTG
jgi:hypothetical protein